MSTETHWHTRKTHTETSRTVLAFKHAKWKWHRWDSSSQPNISLRFSLKTVFFSFEWMCVCRQVSCGNVGVMCEEWYRKGKIKDRRNVQNVTEGKRAMKWKYENLFATLERNIHDAAWERVAVNEKKKTREYRQMNDVNWMNELLAVSRTITTRN